LPPILPFLFDPNAVEDARRERIERERGTARPAIGT
jgi:hypothetical protein